MKWRRYLILLGIVLVQSAFAEPTQVTVRVLGKDSKFIGSTMGGMRITLRDEETGELLAQGSTAGGTGDTQAIMIRDKARGALISSGAASYTATVDIDEPKLIRITALGPLAQRQAAGTVSVTHWLVPGKHITGGDGLVLEIPGFAVDVLAPGNHSRLDKAPQTVEIKANITMMCGCLIEPGSLWDPNKYEVNGLVKHNGKASGQFPLKYAGAASQFAGTLAADKPGIYEITVYAYDPSNGNTGVDKVVFTVD
jgi:hypothetical protein